MCWCRYVWCAGGALLDHKPKQSRILHWKINSKRFRFVAGILQGTLIYCNFVMCIEVQYLDNGDFEHRNQRTTLILVVLTSANCTGADNTGQTRTNETTLKNPRAAAVTKAAAAVAAAMAGASVGAAVATD
jgi:hypothetical protein